MKISLLPKQDAFVFSKAKFCAFFGGFGNGKTVAGCVKAMNLSLSYPGNFGLIGRLTYPELKATTRRTFFELFGCNEETISSHPLVERFSRAENHLRFKNGSEIIFRPLESPSDLLSLNLGWFYVDQAEEISEEVFMTLQARLRLDRVPQRTGFITGNPEGHNWIWRRFVKSRDPDYHMVEATSLENPYLPPDYVPTLLKSYPETWIRRYVYGSWDVFEGQIYGDFDPKAHVVNPFSIPAGWPRYRSIDHGRTNPTCCLWLALDQDGNVFVYREYYVVGKIVSEHARAIRELSAGESYIYTVIDPSCAAQQAVKHGSIIDEYMEHGIDVVPARNDLRAGINRVAEYLRVDPDRIHPLTERRGSPRLFIFNTCENLIREFPRYRWRRLRTAEQGARNLPEEPLGVDDHALDALRYFLMSRPIPADAPAPGRTESRVEQHLRRIIERKETFVDDHLGGLI